MALPLMWFGGQSDAGDGNGGRERERDRRRSFSGVPATGLRDPAPDTAEIDACIVRLRAGDHNTFQDVWDAHHVPLANFAYRYLRSEDAAADVVQQVFIALWEKRSTLHVRTTIGNYLYSAVRNRIGNLARHERVVRAYATQFAAQHAHAESPERANDLVETAELISTITRVVQALPPRTREIFLLSREDGLPPAEIAAMLGIGVQVVYNQLARALKALSEALPRE